MEFDLEAFRAAYPQFAVAADPQVLAMAGQAVSFLSSYGATTDQLQWQLMVAHLLTLSANAAAGGTTGQVSSATVDKVSVSITPPPTRDGWAYWLSTTPYGLQLWALIQRLTAAGLYVGGSAERAAFRGAGGAFPNGGRVWRR